MDNGNAQRLRSAWARLLSTSAPFPPLLAESNLTLPDRLSSASSHIQAITMLAPEDTSAMAPWGYRLPYAGDAGDYGRTAAV